MSAREELDPLSSDQHNSCMLLVGAGTCGLSPKESEGYTHEPMDAVHRLDRDKSVHALAESKSKVRVGGELKELTSKPQGDEPHPVHLSVRSVAGRAGSMEDMSRQLESREDQRICRSAHLQQWLAEQEKEQPRCWMVVAEANPANTSSPNQDKNTYFK